MKNFLFVIFSISFLVSCASYRSGIGQPLARATYAHVNATPLNVSTYRPVSIVGTEGVVKPEGFHVDPLRTVYDYLQNGFEATGTQGMVVATIADVSIDYGQEKSDSSFNAAIGIDRKDYYRVRVMVKLEGFGLENYRDSSVTLKVHRNILISEHSSLVNREKAQIQAMSALVDDLDIAIRKVFAEKFQVLG